MNKEIAAHLLDIGAVFLQPNDHFTWSSGLKSPIYCDNRLTMSYPEVRKAIARGLADIIRKSYPEAELIAGTATAGIPHAAWVSELLDLPMCYVRSKPKGHGKGKQIEGKAVTGQKVVVVEDLISTGGSSITAVEALREAGCEVLGVAAIFSYGLEIGREKLQAAEVKAEVLTNYDTLVEAAVEKGMVSSEDVEKLADWKETLWGQTI